jgi:hypothetical protein
VAGVNHTIDSRLGGNASRLETVSGIADDECTRNERFFRESINSKLDAEIGLISCP